MTGSACFRRRQLSPARRDRVLLSQRLDARHVAASSGPAGYRDRVGAWSYRPVGVVSASPARASALGATTAILPTKVLTRSGTIAPQPSIPALCPGPGPVAGRLHLEQPVFRSVLQQQRFGRKQTPRRAERAAIFDSGRRGFIAVASRSADSAAHRRPLTARAVWT